MLFQFKKKANKNREKKPGNSLPKYVYKPGENVLAFRVEYREDATYVYPGWAKIFVYRIEGDKIYPAGAETPSYIIIEKDVYDAAGEKLLFRAVGSELYSTAFKKTVYELRDSIRVQGTL